MTIFLTEKSIDDMIDTKRNGIKKIKRKSMDYRKKKNLIWKGESFLFVVVIFVFLALCDLCGDPHRGADPEAGQCTAS